MLLTFLLPAKTPRNSQPSHQRDILSFADARDGSSVNKESDAFGVDKDHLAVRRNILYAPNIIPIGVKIAQYERLKGPSDRRCREGRNNELQVKLSFIVGYMDVVDVFSDLSQEIISPGV